MPLSSKNKSMHTWRHLFSNSLLVGCLIVLTGCGGDKPFPYRVELEVWGVFDDSDALREVFSQYHQLNPYVAQINYRKLAPETYRADLIDALASGKGPDIFMVHNTWVDGFADKITPAPSVLVNEKKFRETMIDVVAADFLGASGEVLAVPLFADSLALYYNKDIFNAAGIAEPPKTWEELLSLVPKLVEIDRYGNITRSAVSLGTGENINRAADLLLLLMLQMGVDISDSRFATSSQAQKAFEFYTQFARANSPFYTWSRREHYSIDAFYEGTLAMTINYAYHHDTFRQKNAKLNFAVAPVPQFAGETPANLANYWGLAVAKNKTYVPPSRSDTPLSEDQYRAIRTHESWQLLEYLAFPHLGGAMTLVNAISPTSKTVQLSNDPTQVYLERTKKPAARRDLLETQKSSLALGPFVRGNLIAKSWQPVGNAEAVEALLTEAINAVNQGERTISEALSVFTTRSTQFR